jgi:glycosyltransferase involved in cell wall biosynthesis
MVSVVIPAHNAARSIIATLDSVLAQCVPVDVIVIDDGSTDETARVAGSHGTSVRVLRQENLGQGAARNRGLSIARGEFVAFLDADDYWKPRFLLECIQFLRQHEDAVAVSTGLVILDVDGRETIQPRTFSGAGAAVEPFLIPHFFDFWAKHDHVRTGSVLIRRSAIDAAGPQRSDLRVSQDLEYWAMLGTVGPWGFVPLPLWVGNSRAAAADKWLEKYRRRRMLCPTVEAWESRVRQRLSVADEAGFLKVRGRVAANFAHSKVLGGAMEEARDLVCKYGDEMPDTWMTKLLRAGLKLGRPGWNAVCAGLIAKEKIKAARMRRKMQ